MSDVAALYDAALAAFQRNDQAEALRLCEWLLSSDPMHRDGLILRANLAIKADAVNPAIDALTRLIDAHGGQPAWRQQLARLHNKRSARHRVAGASTAARSDLRTALRLDGGNTDAWFNLALCERDAGNDQAAAQAVTELLRRQPDDEGGRLLAAQLLLTRNPTACIEQVASLRSSESAAEVLQIATRLDQGGDPGAAKAFGEAMRLSAGKRPAPLLRAELGEALALPAVVDSRELIVSARQRFTDGLSELEARWDRNYLSRCEASLEQLVWCNFKLAYQGENDVEPQSRYGDLLQRPLQQWFPEWCDAPLPSPDGPRRIGLLSSCWCDCTVGHYFGGWIDWLAEAGFEVHLYQLGPKRDAHTNALANKAGRLHFHDSDLESLAARIRDDRLHLLIYPELCMDARLLPLAGLRLARRQAVAWGHPTSTGFPSIDAFFSCAAMEPEGASSHYREQLLTLPGIGVHYHLPDEADGHAPALPEGPRLLLPHSLFKLHPDNDAVITELAAQRADVNFLLFREHFEQWNQTVLRRLQRAFSRRGVSVEGRIHWLRSMRRPDYLAVNREADLMLDALHWSGGNTSLDALASGLPLVTSRGRFMRGRQSAAMMDTLGLADWVVPPEALARSALECLADPIRLSAAREQIASERGRLFGSNVAREDFLAHVEHLASAT